jgi:hypothetical protein
MLFFVELNKTNEVKFWLTIYSYFDVSLIMVIIIKKNKYTLSRIKKIIFLDNDDHDHRNVEIRINC